MVARPKRAGHDGDFHAVMLVFADMDVGLGGEREDRMLHRSHVILGDGVRHVADEEILDRVAVRQEWGAGREAGFGHKIRFVLLPIEVVLSCFHT